ncbi:MAG: universal stress protein [Planctomycetaceae bacterium]|nr:universal stress protein [Planctomycetaceae bacterium]
MFHRKPILVPTDYSDASLQAIRVARSIVAADSDITVVHVAMDFDLTMHPLTWTGGPIPNYSEERLLHVLSDWCKDQKLGDVQLAVRKGDPGTTICEVAEEIGCRLIVVPSHGRHGVARLLLGSVTERIIRRCHCSVLVLHRPKNSEVDEPVADTFSPKRVVVPIDFSDAASAAIATALEIAEDRDNVDVISVVPSLDEIMLFGTEESSDEVRRERCQQHMVRYLAEHGFGPLQTHGLIGDPGTTIVHYAGEVKADLIVMPSRGRHGLRRLLTGSTTERVVRQTEIPVLVLRSDEQKIAD